MGYLITLPIISLVVYYHNSKCVKICVVLYNLASWFLVFSENETFFCWLYQSTVCFYLFLCIWSNHYLPIISWVGSLSGFNIQVYNPVVLNSCLCFKYCNYILLLVHISHTDILSHIHVFEHLWHIMIKCLVILHCLILE